VQIGELGMAFLLSALIGLEREIRHKSAGLRTHTLVGFAAALIMLVSKYGFGDVLAATASSSTRHDATSTARNIPLPSS
jgi:putative Mg2+ transporter-C (MgtC) family protein